MQKEKTGIGGRLRVFARNGLAKAKPHENMKRAKTAIFLAAMHAAQVMYHRGSGTAANASITLNTWQDPAVIQLRENVLLASLGASFIYYQANTRKNRAENMSLGSRIMYLAINANFLLWGIASKLPDSIVVNIVRMILNTLIARQILAAVKNREAEEPVGVKKEEEETNGGKITKFLDGIGNAISKAADGIGNAIQKATGGRLKLCHLIPAIWAAGFALAGLTLFVFSIPKDVFSSIAYGLLIVSEIPQAITTREKKKTEGISGAAMAIGGCSTAAWLACCYIVGDWVQFWLSIAANAIASQQYYYKAKETIAKISAWRRARERPPVEGLAPIASQFADLNSNTKKYLGP